MRFLTWKYLRRNATEIILTFVFLSLVGGGCGYIMHDYNTDKQACGPDKFINGFAMDSKSYVTCWTGTEFKVKPKE